MPGSEPSHGRPLRGLTLLEVLAAVFLLGFVYTVLGRTGIQGLQLEGEARRRLEASLLADRVLAEIETQIETGVVPPVGQEEREEEPFAVVVQIAPVSIPVPEPEGEEASSEPPIPGPSFLGAEDPRLPTPLRRIEVKVSWSEGPAEREVRRTTFAFDAESVRDALEALSQAVQAPTAQVPEPDEERPLLEDESPDEEAEK
jgi:hypothetical protein